MTIKEAENIVRSFDEGRKFTDEEEFMEEDLYDDEEG